MTRGFFHDGTYSSFREADHGRPVDTATMPTWRLVVCNQNHDQIGNRAVGDRLTEHLDEGGLGLAALLTLTGPFTPMLFQGEEWAASTPFQFFTSHPEPELGTATAEGRIAEFAKMGWDPDAVPDPQDPATFERSKLDWSQVEDPAAGDGVHARVLDLYRRLVALRRARPELTDPAFGATTCEVDASARLVTLGRGALRVVANSATGPSWSPPAGRGAPGHRRRGRPGRLRHAHPARPRGRGGRAGLTRPRHAPPARRSGR